MNKGLKQYTTQLTQEVANVTSSININKNDANLIINIPLISTVGVNPINTSLIYNYQNRMNGLYFGSGSILNYYSRLVDNTNNIKIFNSDGSVDTYESSNYYYSSETKLKITRIFDDSDDIQSYELKDREGNVIRYTSTSLGMYPTTITFKNGNHIYNNFYSTTKSISNGKGDEVRFVMNDGNITSVQYYHKNTLISHTVIEYESIYDTIKKVTYYLNNNKTYSISLNITSSYIEIIDDVSLYRIKYNINNNKVVSFIDGYSSSYTNGKTTQITYYDHYSKVVDYRNKASYYVFDNFGLLSYYIDSDGYLTNVRYDNTSKDLLSITNNIKLDDEDDIFNTVNQSLTNCTITSTIIDDSIFCNYITSGYKITSSTNANVTYSLNDTYVAFDKLTCMVIGKVITTNKQARLVFTTNEGSITKTISNTYDVVVFDTSFSSTSNYCSLRILPDDNSVVEIAKIMFLKKNNTTNYSYSNDNLNQVAKGNRSIDYDYTILSQVSTKVGVNSNYSDYEYDGSGKVKKVITSYNTYNMYTYDTYNNVTSVLLSNNDETKQTISRYEYESNYHLKSKDIDCLGNETLYTYDSLGRLSDVTNSLGKMICTTYNNNGLVQGISLCDFNGNTTYAIYAYNSKQQLSQITLPNGSIYTFTYDNYNNLSEVKLNNTIVCKYTYNQLSDQILTKETSLDKHQFIYNSDNLLTNVFYIDSYNDVFYKFALEYDNKKRITKITSDLEDTNYIYDNDKLVSVTNSYGSITYGYYNDEIVNKCIESNNKKLYKSTSISKSVSSNPTSLYNTGISQGLYMNIFMDNKLHTNLENEAITPTICDVSINQEDGIFFYKDLTNNNRLMYTLDFNGSSNNPEGCIMLWFKPNTYDMRSIIRIYSTTSEYLEISCYNGSIILYNSKNNSNIIYTSSIYDYTSWNLLAFDYLYRDDGLGYSKYSEYTICCNGNVYKETINNDNNQISFTSHPKYLIKNTLVSSLAISKRKHMSVEDISDFYILSKECIFDNPLTEDGVDTYNFTQENLYLTNQTIQNSFKIYPLNNSMLSLNNDKPLKSKIRYLSTYDKDHTFTYNKQNKRYCYVANGNELVYNFDSNVYGCIHLRCFTNTSLDTQYLFEGKDTNNKKIGLYRNKTKKLCINVNGNIIETTLTLTNDIWHSVILSFSRSVSSDSMETVIFRLRLIVDNLKFETSRATDISYGQMKLSVGRTLEGNNIYPFFGQIECLALRSAYCEESTLNTLKEEMIPITRTKEYDELNYLKRIDIHKDNNNILTNKYVYKTNSGNSYISNLVQEEIIKTNNNYLTSRYYRYDSLGRVTYIYDEYFGCYEYAYDYRGYLVNDNGTTYTYDSNGNITKRGTLVYTYDTTIKDKLIKVGNNTITYSGLLPKTYKNYTYNYEGNRLSSIHKLVDNQTEYYYYSYNIQGLRTKKVVNGKVYNYIYDNNLLVSQISNDNRLDFLYDEESTLYGFVLYDNNSNSINKYFYVRDILGNIIGIIDTNGSVIVEYDYSAYGSHVILGSSSKTIGVINPFRYKGYYYDSETQLFYCNSRYYSPELCRFISPDDIEYLDPQSINGLNLYCYCGNNPIMYTDPSGHLAFSVLLGIGIVVGAIIGGSVSVVSQGIENGWDKIDWRVVAVDAVFGAIDGALSVTGMGALASLAINPMLAGAQVFVTDLVTGDLGANTFEQIMVSMAFSMVMVGASSALSKFSPIKVGYDGINNAGIYNTSKGYIATAKSAKKIAMYKAKQSLVKKTILQGTGGYALFTASQNFTSWGLNQLLGW